MSQSGPKLDSGAGGGEFDLVEASEFVDHGAIKTGKLVGTLLGAAWLTVIAGWIVLVEAVVLVHVRIMEAISQVYVRVITAVGAGGAETLEVSWAAAFRAAVAVEPLLAPAILTLEIIAVSALLLYARRRWF